MNNLNHQAGQDCSVKPARALQVVEQTDRLNHSIGGLIEMTAQLEKRLCSVLRAEPPSTNTDAPREVFACQLAEQLANEVARLEMLFRTIDGMATRLEI